MFEAYGIKVSSLHHIVKICNSVIKVEFSCLNKSFFQLPLLKALIDRLLQDGIEELLHVLSNSKKTKENTERHNSNVITDYTVRRLKEVSDVIFRLYTVCLHFLFPIPQTFQNDYYCYAFYIFSIEFGEISHHQQASVKRGHF